MFAKQSSSVDTLMSIPMRQSSCAQSLDLYMSGSHYGFLNLGLWITSLGQSYCRKLPSRAAVIAGSEFDRR